MTLWICAACGIEQRDTPTPPASCAVCTDDRQYVPEGGQQWTTQQELQQKGHRSSVTELEPDLYAVEAVPSFAIGQRGLLVRTTAGNLLWEPPGYLDPAGVEAVRALGGVAVVAASHPHLVGAAVSWSHAFDDAPVLFGDTDRRWVQRPDPVVRFWSGTLAPLPGLTLVQCGGHFAGSCVAHWAAGADGGGVLLTGDTLMPGADRASVSVMRSFVNLLPLPPRAVHRIAAAVQPYRYDRLYGGFSAIGSGADRIVQQSLQRYLAWLTDDLPEGTEL